MTRARLQKAIRFVRAALSHRLMVLVPVVLGIVGALLFPPVSDVQLVLVVGMILVLAVSLGWWWIWIPRQQIARVSAKMEPKEVLEAENAVRGTVAQLIGGLAILGGLFFSWQQIQDARRDSLVTQQLTEQGQITDRFTQAVEQLGAEERQVRLGGIYALERIARDSPPDAGPVMEVLTAFVRERAPWPSPSTETPQVIEEAAPGRMPLAPPADVQAVLTVIDRGNWGQWWPGEDEGTPGPGGLPCLNLAEADLRGARLRGNALPPLCMRGTNLADANLTDSDLEHADLVCANLVGAHLENANLADGYLVHADLSGADLRGTDLTGAVLTGADLTGARLEGANLKGAINLTQAQLSSVESDAKTTLPPGLHPPARFDQGAPTGSPPPPMFC